MRSHLPDITKRMLIAAKEIMKRDKNIPDMKTFAEAIGADKIRASRWKSGAGNVTIDNMINASYVFGISFEWLGKGNGKMFYSSEDQIRDMRKLLSSKKS